MMKNYAEKKKCRLAHIKEFVTDNDIPMQNLELLNVALTHTSYANEHKGEVIHDND